MYCHFESVQKDKTTAKMKKPIKIHGSDDKKAGVSYH